MLTSSPGASLAISGFQACVDVVNSREHVVRAWTEFDSKRALTAAEKYDREGNAAPLAGRLVGVKDIIDTVDFPTCYGSSIYEGSRPNCDAACVAMIRNAG